jgi:hypothetical protein
MWRGATYPAAPINAKFFMIEGSFPTSFWRARPQAPADGALSSCYEHCKKNRSPSDIGPRRAQPVMLSLKRAGKKVPMNVLSAKAAYAADPAAITAVGADTWSAEFGLAATGHEFEAIIDAVLARYHATAAEFQRDQNSRRALIWTLALPIIFTLSRIVHAELAAERLRQQGRLCRFGDEVLPPDALVARAAIELDWLRRTVFNRTLAARTRVRLFATGIEAGLRGVFSPDRIGYSVMRPRYRMLRQYAAEHAINDRPLVLQSEPVTKAADSVLVDAALSCLVAGRTAVGVIQT